MSTEAPSTSFVTITESAAAQIKTILASDKDNTGKGLRIYVDKGGCSGMQYGMVFDEKKPDDFASEAHGVAVYIDPFSANYLKGSEIDYSDGLNESGFKIKNPNVQKGCGCGKSFEA